MSILDRYYSQLRNRCHLKNYEDLINHLESYAIFKDKSWFAFLD
jgi:hypothetical protein